MLARLGQWFLETVVFKILKSYLSNLGKMLSDYIAKQKKEKADQEAKKKLDEVINKPDATLEEKAKAYEDFFNRNS